MTYEDLYIQDKYGNWVEIPLSNLTNAQIFGMNLTPEFRGGRLFARPAGMICWALEIA